MRSFFYCLGVVTAILWVLGALGLIDYHLCIGLPGRCSVPTTQGVSV